MDKEYFQNLKELKQPDNSETKEVKLNQNKRLLELLLDGQPHSTREIVKEVYGDESLSLSRVSARIWDLEHKFGCIFLDKFGNEITEKGKLRCWKDKETPSIHWYRLKVASYFSPVPKIEIFQNNQPAFKF